jgi:hypothetical protein
MLHRYHFRSKTCLDQLFNLKVDLVITDLVISKLLNLKHAVWLLIELGSWPTVPVSKSFLDFRRGKLLPIASYSPSRLVKPAYYLVIKVCPLF